MGQSQTRTTRTRNFNGLGGPRVHCGVYLDAKRHFVSSTLTIGPL